MSRTLISLSPDLKRLDDDGYEIEVRGGYVLVKHVPYVAEDCNIRYGILISTLALAGDVTTKPDSHAVWFIGSIPCDQNGHPLEASLVAGHRQELDNGLVADYLFSRKPAAGYSDYYHKMTTYEEFISKYAKLIDASATARTFAVIESQDDDSPFNYIDTASSRAQILPATRKLEIGAVAIVGLGGTGSYILDLVAKTPVKEIHLFDSDKFGQHNAFRAPGAPSIETLRGVPRKASYFRDIYSAMHRNIIIHEHVDESTVEDLRSMAFVFIAIDDGASRKFVAEKLSEYEVPFIDVGMGINEKDASLFGTLRVMLSTDYSRNRISEILPVTVWDDEGIYSSNVQVADLNALNAALAVIKWKKFLGFYADLGKEHSIYYQTTGNSLANEDR